MGLRKKISDLPAAVALTGTEPLESEQSGESVQFTVDDIKTYFAIDSKQNIEWRQNTGTSLAFTENSVYGTVASPETGNITVNVALAKRGAMNVVIHNTAAMPTFGSEFVETSVSKGYKSLVRNYIFCQYVNSTKILYWILQEGQINAPRVGSTASSATPSINTDTTDCFSITALAADITSFTTNITGTPSNFQKLIIRIKDNGTSRNLTWGASFEAKGVSLPTATTISKVTTVGLIYDSVTSKWGCVASVTEA